MDYSSVPTRSPLAGPERSAFLFGFWESQDPGRSPGKPGLGIPGSRAITGEVRVRKVRRGRKENQASEGENQPSEGEGQPSEGEGRPGEGEGQRSPGQEVPGTGG